MKRHLFLTGEIQVGKTTAIRRFLKRTGARVDGFVTRFDTREGARRLYFCRFDTVNGESGGRVAVSMNPPDIDIFTEVFAEYGAETVRNSGSSGLIIMDELGVFEQGVPEFTSAVFEKLDGSIPVLGVVKKREASFLDAVRAHPNVDVIEVTADNRDEIPEKLTEWYRRSI